MVNLDAKQNERVPRHNKSDGKSSEYVISWSNMSLLLLFLLFSFSYGFYLNNFDINPVIMPWKCKLRPGLCPSSPSSTAKNAQGLTIHEYEQPEDPEDKNKVAFEKWKQFLCSRYGIECSKNTATLDVQKKG